MKKKCLFPLQLHGRSRVQRYTKTADWDYISECAKLAAPMPLFGMAFEYLPYVAPELLFDSWCSAHGFSPIPSKRIKTNIQNIHGPLTSHFSNRPSRILPTEKRYWARISENHFLHWKSQKVMYFIAPF